jgi:hypothetical protein
VQGLAQHTSEVSMARTRQIQAQRFTRAVKRSSE